MSQASSDFGDDAFGGEMIEAEFGAEEGMMPEQVAPAPRFRKQGFSIYTVMLLMSFAFLLIAAIMFFINAGKF